MWSMTSNLQKAFLFFFFVTMAIPMPCTSSVNISHPKNVNNWANNKTIMNLYKKKKILRDRVTLKIVSVVSKILF